MSNIITYKQKTLAIRGIGREFATLLDVSILDMPEHDRALACRDALIEALRGDIVGQGKFWEFLMIVTDQVQYHTPVIKKGKANKPATIKDLFLGECNTQQILDHFGLVKITTEHLASLPGLQQPYKAGNVLQSAHHLGLELDAKNFFPAYANANRFSAITALRNLVDDMTDKKSEKRTDLLKDFTGETLTAVVNRLAKAGKNWAEVVADEHLASTLGYAPPIAEPKTLDVTVSNVPAYANANTPEGSTPEGNAPEGNAPEGSTPEGNAPKTRAPHTAAGTTLADMEEDIHAALTVALKSPTIQALADIASAFMKADNRLNGQKVNATSMLRATLAELPAEIAHTLRGAEDLAKAARPTPKAHK
jgi:hypothetical protein